MRYDTLTVGIVPPRLHIVVDVVLPANDACSTNVAGRYVAVAKEGHGVVSDKRVIDVSESLRGFKAVFSG